MQTKTLTVALSSMILGFIAFVALAPKDRAANFQVTTLDGETFELAAQQGRPTLVTFWATTCTSCIAEIPDLIALHNDYAERGLNVLGVAMSYDPIQQVQALAQTRALPYLVAHDSHGEVAQAFNGVNLTPTTYLIDGEQSIAMIKVGHLDIPQLRTDLEAML